MIDSIFAVVIRMSASAAVVIPVVLLLRLLLRKIPKIYSYVLWLLVLARLLCPVFPEASFSPMPREISYARVTEEAVSEVAMPDVQADTVSGMEETSGAAQAPTSEPAAARNTSYSFQSVLAILWAAGTGAMLVWGVVSYIIVKHRLRTAVPLRGNAYLADHIGTPFVIGLIRPKIYLPSDLSENWIPHILLHEQYHIRRADPMVKFLFYFALCIHWFNPLVWLAYWLMGRDMEMSCDEAVMRKLGDSARTEYAESLLCLATGRRSIVAAPLAFGEGDTGGRIRNVLNYRKPKFWVCLIAVIVCAVMAVCFLTDPKESRPAQLEYPGLQWNMSPEEVKKALRISEDMITQEQETFPYVLTTDYTYTFRLENYTCFGQEAKNVLFSFLDKTGTGEYPGLYRIQIYYPDGEDENTADMSAVREQLTDLYGADSPTYTYQDGMSANGRTVNTFPPKWMWIPDTRAGEYLTEEEIDRILQHYRDVYENTSPEGAFNFAVELSQWDGVIRDYPLVTLSCSEYNSMLSLHPEELRQAGMTNYSVQFEAGSLVAAMQYLELQDVVYYNADLLEYPGLRWTATPAEVKMALGIGSEDILYEFTRAEKQEDYAADYAEYAFGVAGLEFFGEKTETVVFRFYDYTWTMSQPRLAQIEVYYPDGYAGEAADLKKIEAEITRMYGQPVEEAVSRFWSLDGIEEIRSPVDPDAPVWKSKTTGWDVLTEQEVESIYQQVVEAHKEKGDTDWIPTLDEYKTVLDTEVVSIFMRKNYSPPGGAEITEEVRAQGRTNYVLTVSAAAYLSLLHAADYL